MGGMPQPGEARDDADALRERLAMQLRLLVDAGADDDKRKGYSRYEWRLFCEIARHDGAALSALAEHTHLTLSSASRCLEKLVGRGFVTRHRVEANRRMYAIRITPAGRQAYEAAQPGAVTGVRAAILRLPADDLAALVRLLDKCLPESGGPHHA